MNNIYAYLHHLTVAVRKTVILFFTVCCLFIYSSASVPCPNPSGPQTIKITSISTSSSPVTMAGTVGMQYTTNVTGVIIFANEVNANASPKDSTDYNVGDVLPSGSIVIFKGGTVGASIPWSYNSTAQGGTPLKPNTFYYLNVFSYAAGSCKTNYSGTWIFSGMMPNITLTGNAAAVLCGGTATTATVSYGSTTGVPDQYALLWSTAAKNAGFINNPANALCGNGNYVTLTASPIIIDVPAGVKPGTYTGYIDVNNSFTGFDNCNYNGAGTVNCPSFQINITSGTPPPTGSTPQSFCADAPHTVGDLKATGTAIQWYDAATGGNLLSGNALLIDGLHYYASQTISKCESTSRLDVTVAIYALPTLPVITVSNDTLLCSADPSYVSWQWILDGTPIPGATSEIFVASQDGIYEVTVTDTNGCSSTAAGFHFYPLALQQRMNESSIYVSPNPAGAFLTFHGIAPAANRLITISIMNVLGELIQEEDVIASDEKFTVNLKTLSSGIYFLQVKTETAVAIRKFIKE